MKKHTPGRHPFWRRALYSVVLLAVSGPAALVIAEIFLRLVPIPGIAYNSFRYDTLTGGGMYPGTTEIYRSDRNEVVVRKVNSWGFTDVEHSLEKKPGTVRIGFFGDSYTEARQVPCDSTFFRRVQADLDAAAAGESRPPVETLAFGVSGRSTLHSYLECTRWMDRAHLDYVVYVFTENDPVDQVRSLKHTPEIPYPILSGDSFVVDNSFRERYAYKAQPPHRAWQYLKAHSLALSTLETRLKLLIRRGIKLRVTKEDREVEGEAVAKVKNAHEFHSDADSLFVYTETMLERVIDKWRRDVTASGRKFVIMYIPSQREMAKPLDEQDSWLPWLIAYCAKNDVPLVDPSPNLVAAKRRGVEVFYDHFTPAGHRCAADAFVAWYRAEADSAGFRSP